MTTFASYNLKSFLLTTLFRSQEPEELDESDNNAGTEDQKIGSKSSLRRISTQKMTNNYLEKSKRDKMFD